MELLASRDSWWMTQCEAALLAEGIPSRWVTPWESGARGALVLDVPASESERASDVLSEQLADELAKRASAERPQAWVPLLLQPDFAFALCLALLLVAFYLVTGGADAHGPLFERGELLTSAFRAGQWWRVVTAATLHADAEHVLGNAAFLVLLGWAASERFGPGVMLLVLVVTAVVGFLASVLFTDVGLTVGASGGLFGLLGAAGGHGLRGHRPAQFPWRERVRIGGAAVMLLAFTAFSREANIAAHVGGFVAGMALGVALPAERRPAPAVQIAAGVLAVAVVVVAWMQA